MEWAPELFIVWGRALARDGRVQEAEAQIRRALDASRSQGAKYWELRAATLMARLWRDSGRISEAEELLRPIVDWFTEGSDTAPLVEAKALLWDLNHSTSTDTTGQ